ncbi:MAG TPA: GNAT family N-acetyltransferase [Acidobacteriota bacterium]|nr:GNAT family N-acetyltransferase [Acidobacteriota bacterium]
MKVERLSREHKDQVVETFISAFRNYPVMRFVLSDSGSEYEDNLKALIGFYCELRLMRNWPVLAIRAEDNLVAAALVNNPVEKPLPLPNELLDQLRKIIGESAYKRLETYEKISAEGEPPFPHHFLGMIGVHPDFQGKGYAAALLREVNRMSSQDPKSAGVCLSTEDPGNVRIYQHFGFRTISETDVGDMHSWCMFCPTK